METSLDLNNHIIYNVKEPTISGQGVNKGHADNSLVGKADKSYVDTKTSGNSTRTNNNTTAINNNTGAINNLQTKKLIK